MKREIYIEFEESPPPWRTLRFKRRMLRARNVIIMKYKGLQGGFPPSAKA